jgi:hypothetical protein
MAHKILIYKGYDFTTKRIRFPVLGKPLLCRVECAWDSRGRDRAWRRVGL